VSDRVALVTGSTSGIGAATARRLARDGFKIALHSRRSADVGERMAAELAGASYHQADLTDEQAARGLVAAVVQRHGRLDVLVNNAGINTRGTVEETSAETWDDVFAINVRGPFLCMQQAVKHMKAERRGSIVNVGSVNAYIGQPNLAAYSASKGALMTLTKNSASYLSRYRIRVNQINPGWTLTPSEHEVKLTEGKGEGWLEAAVRTRPFGRLLAPRDIALAAVYLASDESECVTGSVLDLEQYPVGAPPQW